MFTEYIVFLSSFYSTIYSFLTFYLIILSFFFLVSSDFSLSTYLGSSYWSYPFFFLSFFLFCWVGNFSSFLLVLLEDLWFSNLITGSSSVFKIVLVYFCLSLDLDYYYVFLLVVSLISFTGEGLFLLTGDLYCFFSSSLSTDFFYYFLGAILSFY